MSTVVSSSIVLFLHHRHLQKDALKITVTGANPPAGMVRLLDMGAPMGGSHKLETTS